MTTPTPTLTPTPAPAATASATSAMHTSSSTSSPNESPQHKGLPRHLQTLFWLTLVVFLAWDFVLSKSVDFRNDPPLISAGSGKVSAAVHCSMPE